MLRRIASKVTWMARAATTVVGLAIMLALVLGMATTALGANGQAWILGQNNAATAITKLAGAAGVNGPMLQLINNNPDANDTALDLRVQAGEAPMRVNSGTRVANLNADKLDGRDFSAFGAQQVIDRAGPLPVEGSFTSRGGTLIVSVSGSGYRGTGSSRLEGKIGIDVRIDGGFQGVLSGYTNERNSHKAFVSEDLVVRGFPAGQHTVTLGRIYAAVACNKENETRDHYCTATDANDFFSVTVTEIPD